MTIERAAKAMTELDGFEWDDTQKTASSRRTYSRLARAALDATAEPTPKMIYAGANALTDFDGQTIHQSVAEMWRAMHAAMMKEMK